MSKKLLAALIAFSMVGAFGCTESEDDNNGGNGGGNGCTQGARQCKGTVPQMCIAGSWTDGTDCGAVGCNAATGMCNTNGGNNNPGGDNNNPGGDNNNPGGDTTVGATCDPATYAGACSTDGSKRYYCDNTSSVIVEKPCNSGTVCEIQGVNSTKCVADPNCSATETKETSCSDGKDNDCDGWIDSNDHDCTGGDGNGSGGGNGDSGSTTLPSDIPTTCEKGKSAGICGSDGMPYICGDDGYYKGKCETGTCFECPDGYWVACGDSEETACAGHMTAPTSCDYGTDLSSCDDNTAKYCKYGDVWSITSCGAQTCIKCDDGYVGCTSDTKEVYCADHAACTGDPNDPIKSGGNLGDCCSIKEYVPTCSEDGSTVTYCNSTFKVKTKNCASKQCSVTGTTYECK